jgi:hypothetical protein
VNTRLGLSGALAVALALVAACLPAQAQTWVDPPKPAPGSAPARPDEPRAASPARPFASPSEATREASVAQPESTPAPRPAAPTGTETAASAAPRSDRAPADPSAAAQQLAIEYLAFWSAPNAVTLTATPEFYAPLVIFHGRGMTARELFEEKLRFVRRWPERSYTPRLDTLRVSCDAATEICTVRTAFEFIASNPERGRRSQGSGNLELGVSFVGKRPLIVGETSRVTRRRSGAATSNEDSDD